LALGVLALAMQVAQMVAIQHLARLLLLAVAAVEEAGTPLLLVVTVGQVAAVDMEWLAELETRQTHLHRKEMLAVPG
jgi:hypothetical protein